MAQSISPSEFSSRFPLKGAERELTDIHYGDLQLDRNSAITGIVHGNVVVPANLSAEIMGRVHGSVTIESQGVAYISGVVDGAVRVDGAALITGTVEGALKASENAVIAVTGFVGAR
jgi:hypothetical protein